jgi:hypothetical protein
LVSLIPSQKVVFTKKSKVKNLYFCLYGTAWEMYEIYQLPVASGCGST